MKYFICRFAMHQMKYVVKHMDQELGHLCYLCGLCRITFYDLEVLRWHLSGLPHARKALQASRRAFQENRQPERGPTQEPMKE